MTDLEIVKKCAEKIGVKHRVIDDTYIDYYDEGLIMWRGYNPLTDDAQAMALVKKFGLEITRVIGQDFWRVWNPLGSTRIDGTQGYDADLNRAICECVAKLP